MLKKYKHFLAGRFTLLLALYTKGNQKTKNDYTD